MPPLLAFSIVFGEVFFSELPEILIDFLQIKTIKFIESPEFNQNSFESAVVFQFFVSEFREVIPVPEEPQHLVYVAVIDRKRQRIMVAAVLGIGTSYWTFLRVHAVLFISIIPDARLICNRILNISA